MATASAGTHPGGGALTADFNPDPHFRRVEATSSSTEGPASQRPCHTGSVWNSGPSTRASPLGSIMHRCRGGALRSPRWTFFSFFLSFFCRGTFGHRLSLCCCRFFFIYRMSMTCGNRLFFFLSFRRCPRTRGPWYLGFPWTRGVYDPLIASR